MADSIPLFTGSADAATHGREANRIAQRLAPGSDGLGFGVIWSAASYLLRSGQNPTDSKVLAEAKLRARAVAVACGGRS